MPDRVTVIEQIARVIKSRLDTVQRGEVANGMAYSISVKEVIRPPRRSQHSPGDGVLEMMLADIQDGTPETAESGLKMFRRAYWDLDFWIEPSDDDPTPMDEQQATAIAEIERALAEDFYLDSSGVFAGSGGYAGLGYEARLEAPQLITDEDGKCGVRIRPSVGYAHTDRDPYTALP